MSFQMHSHRSNLKDDGFPAEESRKRRLSGRDYHEQRALGSDEV